MTVESKGENKYNLKISISPKFERLYLVHWHVELIKLRVCVQKGALPLSSGFYILTY